MVAVVRGELPLKGLVHVSRKLVVVMALTDRLVGALGGAGEREEG